MLTGCRCLSRDWSNLITGTGDSPLQNEVQGRQDSLKSVYEEGVGLRNKQGSNEMTFASVGKREGTTCYGEGTTTYPEHLRASTVSPPLRGRVLCLRN